MTKRVSSIAIILGVLLLFTSAFCKEIKFNPVETESMLFLFNKTQIKGSQVEIFAPLQAKLKKALEETRSVQDSTGMVTIEFTQQQLDICIDILNNSNVEAKYLDLILGMKNKLKGK